MDDGHVPQALGYLMPLEGRLVEVHGLEAPVEANAETSSAEPRPSAIDANGLRGRAVGWDDAAGKYIVETFDGVLIGVPEENLQEFEPPAPEDGGFDVAWPSGPESPEFFAEMVVSCLSQKGYCLIQMFTSSRIRQTASEETRDLDDWRLPTRELEVPYMGYDNCTKYTNLPDDSLNQEPQDALGRCDRTLTNLGLLITPLFESEFGYTIWGRRSGMVRVPLGGPTEENLLRPPGLDEVDYDAGGKVYGHINFLERRRLQVMYMVRNEGGHVWLYPNANAGVEMSNVKLPLTENKLLVTLPDIMAYSYKPRGENLLLQTWYVSPPFVADPKDARVVTLPDLHQGKRAMIMSLAFRFAAGACGAVQGRTMWLAGADGAVHIPLNRFDVDLYYSEERYSSMLYVRHGGCMSDDLMLGFDNEFFGISKEEAGVLDPSQRQVMETGYEALQLAGHTRAGLRELACGTYLGDAGSDWAHHAPNLIREQGSAGTVCPHIRSGANGGVNATRLAFALGMRGPCVGVDTACSSSLVSFSQAHRALSDTSYGQLAATAVTRIKTALAMGTCMINGPGTYFAYCAAQMLSISGRSLTFDESANGFSRAEGCGAFLLKMGDSEEDAQLMRACAIGCDINQDGRSASMTAPNGPSQSACIRNSMEEAGLSPKNITVAECHGTGTALGDPIEVGALRVIMRKRDDPIMMTTCKTNFGHMEACAGAGGIAKCVLMLASGLGSPNLHLKNINAHIEFTGYPAMFVTESQDTQVRSGVSGVSSFGVGGTNARADLWARCVSGHLATAEVSTLRTLKLKSAQYARIKDKGKLGPHGSDSIFIAGSWNAWSDMVEMEALAEGEYVATIALGETRCEKFRIVVNEDPRQSFYPVDDSLGDLADICGPDWDAKDRGWLLDGREDGAKAGTVYRVKFEWGFSWDRGEHKRVTWEKVEDEEAEAEVPQVDCRTYKHRYFVAGSWTAGKYKPMELADEDSSLHRIRIRIGVTGQEWFHIVRDGDKAQAFHPAAAATVRTSVPVRGPDDEGEGKNWIIHGPTGDNVTIEFQIKGELTIVRLKSAMQGVKIWTSRDNNDWHDFHISRKSSHWDLEPMHRLDTESGEYKCQITLDGFSEDFQIVMDRDTEQVLYPHRGFAGLGEGAVCGPDAGSDMLCWRLCGRPGHVYEVSLDVHQEDPLQMVRWRKITAELELTNS